VIGHSGRHGHQQTPVCRADDVADFREANAGQHALLGMVVLRPEVNAPQPSMVPFDPGAGGQRPANASSEFFLVGNAAGFDSGKEFV
jgi:hypothetical protein